jgi:hypothetical protein
VPENLIERLQRAKERIDLRTFFKPNPEPGEVVQTRCLWHDDSGRPNLAVYPASAYCFVCGMRHDHLDVVKARNPTWSFRQCVEYLEQGDFPEPPDEEECQQSVDPIPLEYVKSLHDALPDHILCWLEKRGLTRTTIDLALLGYTGLALTIPVFDEWHKDVLTLRFRRDDSKASPSGSKYWGLKGRNKVLLFQAHILHETDWAILCEGEFDCLLLNQEGYPAVSFTNGKSAFTSDYNHLFSQLQTLYICLDQDAASNTRHVTLAKEFAGVVPDLRLVSWPARVAKDVTELIVSKGVSAFAERLKRAVPLRVRRD